MIWSGYTVMVVARCQSYGTVWVGLVHPCFSLHWNSAQVSRWMSICQDLGGIAVMCFTGMLSTPHTRCLHHNISRQYCACRADTVRTQRPVSGHVLTCHLNMNLPICMKHTLYHLKCKCFYSPRLEYHSHHHHRRCLAEQRNNKSLLICHRTSFMPIIL